MVDGPKRTTRPNRHTDAPIAMFARPIIPILITYLSGIVLGETLPGYGGWAIGVAGLAIIAVLWKLRWRRAAFIAPLTLFLALGYLAIQPWTAPDFPSSHVVHHADGKKWILTGTIVEPPRIRPQGTRLIIAASGLEAIDRHYPACGRVQVTVGDGDRPDLKPGDRIQVSGRLKRVYGFHNPGGFNYERYLAFQKIWCRMWVAPKRVVLLTSPTTIPLSGRIQEARQTAAKLIDQSVSGESRQVLKALVVGDRSDMTPSVREVFTRTGIGHLLAISGLHIGIVAAVAFLLFKRLFAYSRFLLNRAWTGKCAAAVTFLPVLVYGVMAGMSPSTQRAVVMVAVFLFAFLAGRLGDNFNTLAVAALVISIVSPPAVFSISFQLSFAAVAFILLGMSRPWPRDQAKTDVRFFTLKKAGSLLTGTVLAIIGTLPLAMQTFNEISLIGVGTNLLAIPLVGFGVVSVGLLGMFISPVSTVFAKACFVVSGTILDVTLAGARFLADLPFASVKTVTPSLAEIAIYYLLVSMGLILAPVFLAYIKGLKWQAPRLTGQLDLKIALTVFLLAVTGAMVDVGYWVYQRYWQGNLKVSIIDVGTGSAALVEFPRGPVMLIDGGGFSNNDVFDMGARVVAPYLWRQKIKTVDTMVLSHPNSDHLNGLIYIARHFKVKQLWHTGETADTKSYRAFANVVRAKKILSPPYSALPSIHEINGVQVTVLHPPIAAAESHPGNSNNNSLVVKVQLGEVAFLFPGDIEKAAEKTLVTRHRGAILSTILIAPHHGSRTSSTPLFLKAVSPETVIISCARDGRYHFPHPTVIERYRQGGQQIFSTARNGAIQMVTNGRTYKIRPTRPAALDTRQPVRVNR